MTERIVEANGVDLCLETFGSQDDPAILLISGGQSSMLGWPDEFCSRLAGAGRFVIRYDNRDTGRSVTYPPGEPGYTFDDLVDDAAALLDVLAVARAHVVGISMGGALAQVMALTHPERIASLTLIATSPVSAAVDEGELPRMAPETAAAFAAVRTPDWSDRAAVLDYLVEQEQLCAGRKRPDEEAALRETAGRIFDRSTNIASASNHFSLSGNEPDPGRFAGFGAPVLILHGSDDPLFAFEHARALRRAFGDATLTELTGIGHELPQASWDRVIPSIVRHTASS
jgi:pimeloyl-ACP methyl ester carboxylesterase